VWRITATILSAGRVATRATDLVLLGGAPGAAVAIPAAVVQGGSWSHGWAVALGRYGIAPVALDAGLWTFAVAAPDAPRLAPIGYATPLLSTWVLRRPPRRRPVLPC
jgi:hypothetical protein